MHSFQEAARGAALASLVLLAACAGNHLPDGVANNDPNEEQNRAVFAANQGLDRATLKPVAEIYNAVLPSEAREAVANMLENIEEPRNFVNSVLQGNIDHAAETLARAALNTTIGIGGVWKPADHMGLEPHKTGFADTLGASGLDCGPYLVLPVVGPSDNCGAVGLVVDSFTNPLLLVPGANLVHTGVNATSQRAEYDAELTEAEKAALDYYAKRRSIDQQRRADKIRKAKREPAGPVAIDYTDPGATPKLATAAAK